MFNKVRTLRKQQGLSQSELGEKAGLSQVIISEIETGKKYGSIQSLTRIAEVLGVTLSELLKED